MAELPILVLLAVLLLSAVYTDLRYGKIYNKITMPCIAIGIALSTISGGGTGLLSSLAAVVLVLGIYLMLASLAGIGGGDIKLLMAVGALMGVHFVGWSMLMTAVIGGLMALALMARRRVIGVTVGNLAGNLYQRAVLGIPVDPFSGSKRVRLAYSPAIALGALTTLALRHWFW